MEPFPLLLDRLPLSWVYAQQLPIRNLKIIFFGLFLFFETQQKKTVPLASATLAQRLRAPFVETTLCEL